MADEFEDYFQSDTHKRIFEIVFTETFNEAVQMSVGEVGGDVNRAPGLLRAISKMQAYAAAVAHFYKTSALTKQGATYLRGLADQIEGKPDTPIAKAKSARSRVRK